MLTATLRPYAAAGLLISALLVGCNTTKLTFDTLLKHQSETQILVVRNDLHQTVDLIAADENVQNLPLVPGKTMEIQFVVFTTLDLETPESRYWFKAQPGTEDNLIEESGDLEFLLTEGDITLTIRLSDIDFRKYLLIFGDCWFDAAAPQRTHTMIITDKPEEDFREAELCP